MPVTNSELISFLEPHYSAVAEVFHLVLLRKKYLNIKLQANKKLHIRMIMKIKRSTWLYILKKGVDCEVFGALNESVLRWSCAVSLTLHFFFDNIGSAHSNIH